MLLDVRDLKTYFFTVVGVVRAVDGVSFVVRPFARCIGRVRAVDGVSSAYFGGRIDLVIQQILVIHYAMP